MTKVGVLGARGRMGREVIRTVSADPDLEVAAEVDQGDDRDALTGCDVVVDFTHPGVVMDNLRWCVEHDLNVVVGTSGFGEDRLDQVQGWLGDHQGVRVLIVPNFSIGAILMMRFAEQAARFFPSAEVIELHHANKVDAPSGTALRTASLIGAARAQAWARRRTPPCPRCPARAAPLWTTSTCTRCASRDWSRIRRCSSAARGRRSRSGTTPWTAFSFMPGVLLAVRNLGSLPEGLTVGLESLLGLK